jgi:hypothetical protein
MSPHSDYFNDFCVFKYFINQSMQVESSFDADAMYKCKMFLSSLQKIKYALYIWKHHTTPLIDWVFSSALTWRVPNRIVACAHP